MGAGVGLVPVVEGLSYEAPRPRGDRAGDERDGAQRYGAEQPRLGRHVGEPFSEPSGKRCFGLPLSRGRTVGAAR